MLANRALAPFRAVVSLWQVENVISSPVSRSWARVASRVEVRLSAKLFSAMVARIVVPSVVVPVGIISTE